MEVKIRQKASTECSGHTQECCIIVTFSKARLRAVSWPVDMSRPVRHPPDPRPIGSSRVYRIKITVQRSLTHPSNCGCNQQTVT